MFVRQIISLNGTWKAWSSIKGPLSPYFYKDETKMTTWQDISIPSHWQTQKNFSSDDHVLYYNYHFATPELSNNQNVLLEFKGIYYLATIWLNGTQIATYEGFFQPLVINITPYLNSKANFLYVKVEWPIDDNPLERETFSGVWGFWEYKPRDIHPGGIWQDVNLHIVDNAYIDEIIPSCKLTTLDSARIKAQLTVWSNSAQTYGIDWSLTPANFTGKTIKGSSLEELKDGFNRFNIELTLNKPVLWYPWEIGTPCLYTLSFKLYLADHLLDRRKKTMGIRKVAEKNGAIYINEKRIFLRGANYSPADFHLGQVSRKALQRDIQLLLEANLNTVRIYGHVSLPALYDICDENGVLVWQDVPLQYHYKRSFEKIALRLTIQLYRCLTAHPAIIIWGAHAKTTFKHMIKNPLKGWATSRFAKRIAQALKKVDSRPIVETTLPYQGLSLRNKRHFRHENYEGFNFAKNDITFTKGNLNLIASYGFQAFPGIATMSNLGESPDATKLNWKKLTQKYLVQKTKLDQRVPSQTYSIAGTYFMATQYYQARLLRFYHEMWRSMKHQPIAGCFLYYLTDSTPAISASIVDYWRRNKLGFLITKKAMQPVFIMAEWPAHHYMNGDWVKLKLLAVNDTQTPFMASIVRWSIDTEDGETIIHKRYLIDLLADHCVSAEQIVWEIDANTLDGTYHIHISLELPTQEIIRNDYKLTIKN